MAVNRELLTGLGLTEEQADTIIKEHRATVDPMLEKVRKAEGDEATIAELKKQAEDLKLEYNQYKQGVEARENSAKLKEAYKGLLKEAKVDPEFIDTILRATDVSEMKLDAAGKLENADKIAESIQSDWGKFIIHEGKKGGPVPPSQGGSGGKATKSKDEIMAIEDTNERVKAIAENHELFGF